MTEPSHAAARLVPVTGADTLALYELAGLLEPRWYRVCRDGLPPFPAFEQVLWSGVHSLQKVVVGSAPVGVGTVYRVDPVARTGWAELLVAPGLDAVAAEGPLLERLLRDAHARVGLERIHVAHPGFEAPPLSGTGVDWVEEARIREAVLHEGFHWDLVVATAVLEPLAEVA